MSGVWWAEARDAIKPSFRAQDRPFPSSPRPEGSGTGDVGGAVKVSVNEFTNSPKVPKTLAESPWKPRTLSCQSQVEQDAFCLQQGRTSSGEQVAR